MNTIIIKILMLSLQSTFRKKNACSTKHQTLFHKTKITLKLETGERGVGHGDIGVHPRLTSFFYYSACPNGSTNMPVPKWAAVNSL